MRRVVKIGGSLLLRPDLVNAVNAWLDRQSPADHFVIVGGGQMIDAIRALDQVHGLESEKVHWLCVDLLRATYEIVSELFPHWNRIESNGDWKGGNTSTPKMLHQISIVLPESFYHRGNDYGAATDWRTTTDTIAAVLAIHVDADELVLLKSCDIPATSRIETLIGEGIVDSAFAGVFDRTCHLRVEKL